MALPSKLSPCIPAAVLLVAVLGCDDGGPEAVGPTAGSGGALTGGMSPGGSGGAGAPLGGTDAGGSGGEGAASAGSSGTGSTASGGTPGAAGTSGNGGAGAPVGSFELMWEDPFDAIDSARWQLMTHSFDSNLAQFTAANATVRDGVLQLALTAAADGSSKPYLGVEMRSRETLTYGKIEASVRFAAGSGVVSSLVLLYTPWPPPDWNELDIEFLGKNNDRIQFNHMINIPPADPVSGHLQYPTIVSLGFNPSADFHTYAIEWAPGEARFLVDGVLLHTAAEEMARMVLPQNVIMTIWASSAAGWAGPIDATTAPTVSEYDWIKIYRWVEG